MDGTKKIQDMIQNDAKKETQNKQNYEEEYISATNVGYDPKLFTNMQMHEYHYILVFKKTNKTLTKLLELSQKYHDYLSRTSKDNSKDINSSKGVEEMVTELIRFFRMSCEDFAKEIDEKLDSEDMNRRLITFRQIQLIQSEEVQFAFQQRNAFYQTAQFKILISFPYNTYQDNENEFTNKVCDTPIKENTIIIKCILSNLKLKDCDKDEMFQFLETFNHALQEKILSFDVQSEKIITTFDLFIFEFDLIPRMLQKLDICTLISMAILDYKNYITFGYKTKEDITKTRCSLIKNVNSTNNDILQQWKEELIEANKQLNIPLRFE